MSKPWQIRLIRRLRSHSGFKKMRPRSIQHRLSPHESSARVLLVAPTIYLALPLECAHWAIVRGWAEPHYLGSFGLVPAGVVVIYTPKDREELSACYALFHAAY